MSEEVDEDVEHSLWVDVVEERTYEVVVGEDGDLQPGTVSQYMGGKTKKTMECTCGERFRKDELAIDHIEENGGEIKNYYATEG